MNISFTNTSVPTSPDSLSFDGPRLVLRLEAAALMVAAAALYAWLGGSWGWFFALLLVPDVTMLGYLAGSRVGAAVYNLGHTLLGPAALLALAATLGWPDQPLLAALPRLGHL